MEKYVIERTESVISQAFERNGFGAFDRDDHAFSEKLRIIGGPQSNQPENPAIADLKMEMAKLRLENARKKAIEANKK